MKDFQGRFSPMFRRAGTDQSCPSASGLADLAADRAWPWQRRRLVDHLSHCSECADDYQVLTIARDGLLLAMEDHAQSRGGIGLVGWMRSGMVSAAAIAVLALGLSVLVHTGGPGPVDESGILFASEFEPQARRGGDSNSVPERLFSSDFGEPDGEGVQLFRDDFGG